MDDHKQNSPEFLQVLREGMAVVISTVILALAAWTIGQTFLSARGENLEAYNRQKDIMLYVVSLFGTVTGYYLGRVPAEVNARRAEKAANVAQQQLSVSQEKLGEASAAATTAREQKSRASKRLSQSTSELRNVSDAIGKLHRSPRPAAGMGIRAEESAAESGSEAELREAKRRIDTLLAQLGDED